MKIEKKVDGKKITISLEGRLDSNTTPEFEKELTSLDEIENLVLDFEKLEYISSAGLRIILALQKIMNGQRNMVIKNSNDNIKEIFEITGFSDILTLE